jgi:hypothetical protein
VENLNDEQSRASLMGIKYYKSIISSGPMTAGFYRFKDVFQIIPSDYREDGDRFGRSYYELEFSDACQMFGQSESSNLSEEVYARRAHLDHLKELIALIYVSTNYYCELHYDRKRQILPSEQKLIDGFSSIEKYLPIRKVIGRVTCRQNFNASFLDIDSQADIYFENYFKLNVAARKRYNSSIFLYQAMRKVMVESTSMAIVGLISAIENIMDYEALRNDEVFERCSSCKVKQYGLTRRFRDFMLAYSDVESGDAKKLINSYYERRSKIAHAGALLDMDVVLSEFSMRQHREIYNEIESLVRIALYNYLLKYRFDDTAE